MGIANVGNYMLFGGGGTSSPSSAYLSYVYAYNNSLTRSSASSLSENRGYPKGISLQNYAAFFGGNNNTPNSRGLSLKIDAYNSNLTRSTPTTLAYGRDARSGIWATSLAKQYALIYNAYYDFNYGDLLEIYDSSFSRSTQKLFPNTTSNYDYCRYDGGADYIGNYALFIGGHYINYSTGFTTGCYLDNNLVQTTITTPRISYAATGRIENQYIIALAYEYNNSKINTTYAFNSSLTCSTIITTETDYNYRSASSNNYAIFGYPVNSTTDINIHIFDSSLSRSAITRTNTNYVNGDSFDQAYINGYYMFPIGGGNSLNTIDTYVSIN